MANRTNLHQLFAEKFLSDSIVASSFDKDLLRAEFDIWLNSLTPLIKAETVPLYVIKRTDNDMDVSKNGEGKPTLLTALPHCSVWKNSLSLFDLSFLNEEESAAVPNNNLNEKVFLNSINNPTFGYSSRNYTSYQPFEQLQTTLESSSYVGNPFAVNALLSKDVMCGQVSNSIAKSNTGSLSEQFDAKVFDDNGMEDDWTSCRNNYGCDIENPGVAIDGFVLEEMAVCKYFQNGNCLRRDCKDAHVHPMRSEVVLGAPQPTSFVPLTGREPCETIYISDSEHSNRGMILQDGLVYVISVSAFVSPSKFFVVLPFGDTPIDELAKIGVTPESELELLISAMQNWYGIRGARKFYSQSDFYLGQLVAAWFPNDEKWYRARVIDIVDDALQVSLFFVDFGFNSHANRGDVRLLEPHFCQLPFQAVPCCLSDVGPPVETHVSFPETNHTDKAIDRTRANGVWTMKTVNDFRQLVEGKSLCAKVCRIVNSVYHLEIWNWSSYQRSICLNDFIKTI